MRTTHGRIGVEVWTLAVAIVALMTGAPNVLGDEPPPAEESREPFTSPLTDDEARWLIDEAEGRQFRDVPGGRLQRLIEREAEAVRDNLGGSVIREFPTLDGEAPPRTPWWQRFRGSLDPPAVADPPLPDPSAAAEPPAVWPGWPAASASPAVQPATAIEAPAASTIPVATLRIAAEGLDESANRLEELQLYEQADDMRALAQKLRVDARRLATDGENVPRADSALPTIGLKMPPNRASGCLGNSTR